MNQCEANIIGLLCDIVGAILLFFFGLPSDLNKKGLIFRVLDQVDEAEIKKWKVYDFWSKIGIFLIVAGFCFQLYSVVMFMPKPTSQPANKCASKNDYKRH